MELKKVLVVIILITKISLWKNVQNDLDPPSDTDNLQNDVAQF